MQEGLSLWGPASLRMRPCPESWDSGTLAEVAAPVCCICDFCTP